MERSAYPNRRNLIDTLNYYEDDYFPAYCRLSKHLYRFKINSNRFLKKAVNAYFYTLYLGYNEQYNPNYLNDLKNTFNNIDQNRLYYSKRKVSEKLIELLPQIISIENLSNPTVVCVPRAKANMAPDQLLFQKAVSEACKEIINAQDGAYVIKRVINTRTTHLKKSSLENDGDLPYPGITLKTCKIDNTKIEGKDVILIDDIYTYNCNIDEDCIQALYENGAKKVVFFSIAFTERKN